MCSRKRTGASAVGTRQVHTPWKVRIPTSLHLRTNQQWVLQPSYDFRSFESIRHRRSRHGEPEKICTRRLQVFLQPSAAGPSHFCLKAQYRSLILSTMACHSFVSMWHYEMVLAVFWKFLDSIKLSDVDFFLFFFVFFLESVQYSLTWSWQRHRQQTVCLQGISHLWQHFWQASADSNRIWHSKLAKKPRWDFMMLWWEKILKNHYFMIGRP